MYCRSLVLKKSVVLEDLDTGEAIFFRSCMLQNHGTAGVC